MDLIFVFDFFFQAEDGIRDGHVTGVQTVLFRSPERRNLWILDIIAPFGHANDVIRYIAREFFPGYDKEIGRASCRERVEILIVGVALKEKNKSEGSKVKDSN